MKHKFVIKVNELKYNYITNQTYLCVFIVHHVWVMNSFMQCHNIVHSVMQ